MEQIRKGQSIAQPVPSSSLIVKAYVFYGQNCAEGPAQPIFKGTSRVVAGQATGCGRVRPQNAGMESDERSPADATISGAVERGATSDNFDLSANVDRGDGREVDPALFKMEKIISERGCTFDEAREIYNREKMREAGIDPDSGLSTDPKAVHSAEAFAAVFDGSSAVVDPRFNGSTAARAQWLLLRAGSTRAYWQAQSDTFGPGL
jgi:hypothetical protein